MVADVLLKESAIKRLLEPEDVAALVGWLASPDAGMVTGASYTHGRRLERTLTAVSLGRVRARDRDADSRLDFADVDQDRHGWRWCRRAVTNGQLDESSPITWPRERSSKVVSAARSGWG